MHGQLRERSKCFDSSFLFFIDKIVRRMVLIEAETACSSRATSHLRCTGTPIQSIETFQYFHLNFLRSIFLITSNVTTMTQTTKNL